MTSPTPSNSCPPSTTNPAPDSSSPCPGSGKAAVTSTGHATSGWLGHIERIGNALPHPATLFALLAVGVVVVSWFCHLAGAAVVHPVTKEVIPAVNLLSVAGLHRFLKEVIANFTGFAPLGTVLVSMLGIGIAEASGLIGTCLRLLVLTAPARLLTFVVVFAGIMSNAASEAGYVLLVPLSATLFLTVGRHPIAGLAAAFAGVSGGYSANLLLGTVDPLLAGLTQEAARLIDPSYVVSPACNYYFMAASTFVLAGVGTWVTEAVVVPRLGRYAGPAVAEPLHPLTDLERRGLRWATAVTMLFLLVLLAGVLPAGGFLRDPKTDGILHSPFMDGIVAFIFLLGAGAGAAYGFATGVFRTDADLMKGMEKTMATMGGYLVLVFFAAQFVAFFKWSNLGLLVAVRGAEALQASGLGPVPLMIAFVVLSAFINLFMGSASAKWSIMAPIFVPMFMLLRFSPELVQVAYRIGDSVTNVISPLMSYFALILAFVERYEPKSGLGTLVATMLPYSLAFLAAWALLLGFWIVLGLPVGPGAGLFLP